MPGLCTYMWGGDIKIGARSYWAMGMFVLVLSNINIIWQKSLSAPLSGGLDLVFCCTQQKCFQQKHFNYTCRINKCTCHKPKKNHTNCFHVPTSNKSRVNSSKTWTDMVISTVSLLALQYTSAAHFCFLKHTHTHTSQIVVCIKNLTFSIVSLSHHALPCHLHLSVNIDPGLPRWWSSTQSPPPHTHTFVLKQTDTQAEAGRVWNGNRCEMNVLPWSKRYRPFYSPFPQASTTELTDSRWTVYLLSWWKITGSDQQVLLSNSFQCNKCNKPLRKTVFLWQGSTIRMFSADSVRSVFLLAHFLLSLVPPQNK